MVYKIYSYAKITLFLDVISKRTDGYHNVKIILQNIDLYDLLFIKTLKSPYFILKSNYDIPLQKNLIYKAYSKFIEKTKYPIGLEIFHYKKIPIGGGLGGGSSNAGSILYFLNFITKFGLSKEDLSQLAIQLGSDVPFFLYGGTALAEEKGEKITKLKNLPSYFVLLILPNFSISTKEIYGEIKERDLGEHLDWKNVISNINNQKLTGTFNLFEDIVFRKYRIIKDIKEFLLLFTPLVSLSGTGSSIYALFDDLTQLKKAREKFIEKFPNSFKIKTCKFVNRGIYIKGV
ncbi:MAG: 4-(cytidine 5'-diphospho)-2-C-methyl-D-erythritol kinase [Dictyoglomus sp. NZ13-RE01]|nr:MAG: 4-(cytidine 5'-diphospho)-2-C-methyl-D-erythritol kinase [Dictyoglomus sp. NZ13-RE01]